MKPLRIIDKRICEWIKIRESLFWWEKCELCVVLWKEDLEMDLLLLLYEELWKNGRKKSCMKEEYLQAICIGCKTYVCYVICIFRV